MKNYLLLFVLSFSMLMACGQDSEADKATLREEIKSLEKVLIENLDANKVADTAKLVVSKSLEYAAKFPQDSLAAGYLFKAADVSNGLKDYGKAIKYWGQVWRNYPAYKKAADALFLQGFTYENALEDKDNAKVYYQDFLKRFPDHPLASQVTLSLEMMDKNLDDLIKEFETKYKD